MVPMAIATMTMMITTMTMTMMNVCFFSEAGNCAPASHSTTLLETLTARRIRRGPVITEKSPATADVNFEPHHLKRNYQPLEAQPLRPVLAPSVTTDHTRQHGARIGAIRHHGHVSCSATTETHLRNHGDVIN